MSTFTNIFAFTILTMLIIAYGFISGSKFTLRPESRRPYAKHLWVLADGLSVNFAHYRHGFEYSKRRLYYYQTDIKSVKFEAGKDKPLMPVAFTIFLQHHGMKIVIDLTQVEYDALLQDLQQQASAGKISMEDNMA